jgi:hypothetical protein
MNEVEAASPKLNLQLVRSEIRQADDIAPAFAALKDGADGLYVCADPPSVISRVQLNALAPKTRLPTTHGGGLLYFHV